MQVNSITPHCRAYSVNSVSMKGRTSGTKAVVGRVMKFLGENGICFDGKFSINGKGALYEQTALGSLKYPYFLRMADGTEKELKYLNCASIDEIAYKFAKEASGKTIYNREQVTCACIMSLLGVNTSAYKPTIKVPDFFK